MRYTRSDVNYPASLGWTAALHLVGPEVIAPISGTASGDSFVFQIDASATATKKPGRYQWRELATKTGESPPRVFIMAGGIVDLLANIAASSAGEMRSWEERCLELVEIRLEGRFTSDMERYSVAGRSVDKMKMTELLKVRNWLTDKVRQQAKPGTFGDEIRFSLPGMDTEE